MRLTIKEKLYVAAMVIVAFLMVRAVMTATYFDIIIPGILALLAGAAALHVILHRSNQ